MSRFNSSENSRANVMRHIRRFKAGPSFGEPTPDQYKAFAEHHTLARAQNHTLNRGKRQISVDLGVTMDAFERLFTGKSVLDVGCGTGVLSSEIARLKKTKVTALDHDPEVLDKVKQPRNLRAVLGSGFDIAAAVGDEKFDVVISSFSSFYWAKNETEKKQSILSPLESCADGGRAIFVPVLAEPGLREVNRRAISQAMSFGLGRLSVEEAYEIQDAHATTVVGDWLDVTAIETLTTEESNSAIDLVFSTSRDNAKNLHIGRGATLERYSVIATILS